MRHTIDLADYTGLHVQADPIPGRGAMLVLHFRDDAAAAAAQRSLAPAVGGAAVSWDHPPGDIKAQMRAAKSEIYSRELGQAVVLAPGESILAAVADLIGRIPPDTPPEMVRLRVGNYEFRADGSETEIHPPPVDADRTAFGSGLVAGADPAAEVDRAAADSGEVVHVAPPVPSHEAALDAMRRQFGG